MQLLRISKGRAALNAVLAFAMGIGFNAFGGGFIGGPCIIVGLIFALVVAWKFYNDVKRAQVGLLYQHSEPDYEEPPAAPSRGFGIFDPNDL